MTTVINAPVASANAGNFESWYLFLGTWQFKHPDGEEDNVRITLLDNEPITPGQRRMKEANTLRWRGDKSSGSLQFMGDKLFVQISFRNNRRMQGEFVRSEKDVTGEVTWTESGKVTNDKATITEHRMYRNVVGGRRLDLTFKINTGRKTWELTRSRAAKQPRRIEKPTARAIYDALSRFDSSVCSISYLVDAKPLWGGAGAQISVINKGRTDEYISAPSGRIYLNKADPSFLAKQKAIEFEFLTQPVVLIAKTTRLHLGENSYSGEPRYLYETPNSVILRVKGLNDSFSIILERW